MLLVPTARRHSPPHDTNATHQLRIESNAVFPSRTTPNAGATDLLLVLLRDDPAQKKLYVNLQVVNLLIRIIAHCHLSDAKEVFVCPLFFFLSLSSSFFIPPISVYSPHFFFEESFLLLVCSFFGATLLGPRTI